MIIYKINTYDNDIIYHTDGKHHRLNDSACFIYFSKYTYYKLNNLFYRGNNQFAYYDYSYGYAVKPKYLNGSI